MNACIDSCDITNNDFNNIESLRKGFIYLNVGFISSNNNIASAKCRASSSVRMVQAVPIRLVCIHLCYPNTELYKIRGKVVGMIASVFNSRTKIHLGNPIEWQYALQGYGIPIEIIPFTNTGTIKLDNWKKWTKLKKHTEQHEMTVSMKTSTKTSMKTPLNSIVECPGSNDVVFRMGRSMNYHPGNVKFQNIIESQFQHLCIKTGFIVWINGPFPAGNSEGTIFRNDLATRLEDWESRRILVYQAVTKQESHTKVSLLLKKKRNQF